MGNPRCWCSPSYVCAACFIDGGHTVPACWRPREPKPPTILTFHGETGDYQEGIVLRSHPKGTMTETTLIALAVAGGSLLILALGLLVAAWQVHSRRG